MLPVYELGLDTLHDLREVVHRAVNSQWWTTFVYQCKSIAPIENYRKQSKQQRFGKYPWHQPPFEREPFTTS